jgi:hypothetical protein
MIDDQSPKVWHLTLVHGGATCTAAGHDYFVGTPALQKPGQLPPERIKRIKVGQFHVA